MRIQVGVPQCVREVSGEAGPIDPDFANRVWILSIRVSYCIADNEGPCEGSDDIVENGGTTMQFSIIMAPD